MVCLFVSFLSLLARGEKTIRNRFKKKKQKTVANGPIEELPPQPEVHVFALYGYCCTNTITQPFAEYVLFMLFVCAILKIVLQLCTLRIVYILGFTKILSLHIFVGCGLDRSREAIVYSEKVCIGTPEYMTSTDSRIFP